MIYVRCKIYLAERPLGIFRARACVCVCVCVCLCVLLLCYMLLCSGWFIAYIVVQISQPKNRNYNIGVIEWQWYDDDDDDDDECHSSFHHDHHQQQHYLLFLRFVQMMKSTNYLHILSNAPSQAGIASQRESGTSVNNGAGAALSVRDRVNTEEDEDPSKKWERWRGAGRDCRQWCLRWKRCFPQILNLEV